MVRTGQAAALMEQIRQREKDVLKLPASVSSLIAVLRAIMEGSRDPTLAEMPKFHYTTAAEVLWLIERLG
jgi:hypothetical protein